MMTQEQKAKAYDEALEKLRSLYDDYDTVSTLIDIKEELEHIFPELAESEDERIRKEMITYLSTVEDKELIPYESWIAWLEKQGKHANFRNKIQIGDKVTRNEDGVLVNLSQLKRIAKKDEKQGEQKPANKVERKGMNIVEEDMTPFQKKVFCIIDTTIEEEQGLKQVCDELLRLAHDEIMQESAWSKEDEKILRTIISDGLRGASFDMLQIEWLKSLKDRVQQKQAWCD